MSEPQTIGEMVKDLLLLLIREAVRYVCFVINVPLAFSVAGLAVVSLIVMQDVYGAHVLKWLAGFVAPGHSSKQVSWHLDMDDVLRIYAIATFAIFVVWELIRLIFRIKRATFLRFVLNGAVALTVGWGLVIAHVPYITMARGSSRVTMGWIFFAFYMLGLISFLIGSAISGLTEAFLQSDGFLSLLSSARRNRA